MDVRRFSVTVVFGPSGCGKTTLLRCLAGLDCPDEGTIRWDQELWFDQKRRIWVPPQRRQVGFMAQDYALFPHLTVAGNIAFGLRRWPAKKRAERVGELIDLFGLAGLQNRYPKELSGGQQQRTALARTLAPQPRLLLLDEPLSALDAQTREALLVHLRRWLATIGIPTLIVSHHRGEVFALGDDVLIMHNGTVCQNGPVDQVFSRPNSATVAAIVGMETVVPGEVLSIEDGLARVQVGQVTLWSAVPSVQLGRAYVTIRAEDVILEQHSPHKSSARNRLSGRIISCLRDGPMVRVQLDCGFQLTAAITRLAFEELQVAPGDLLDAVIKATHVHVVHRA
jgi:molybdate transport system ATP-binding protein